MCVCVCVCFKKYTPLKAQFFSVLASCFKGRQPILCLIVLNLEYIDINVRNRHLSICDIHCIIYHYQMQEMQESGGQRLTSVTTVGLLWDNDGKPKTSNNCYSIKSLTKALNCVLFQQCSHIVLFSKITSDA